MSPLSSVSLPELELLLGSEDDSPPAHPDHAKADAATAAGDAQTGGEGAPAEERVLLARGIGDFDERGPRWPQ